MSKALKVLHSKLEPLERAVFLLKEVFDFDYEALQETLDKKKDHCRQLLCRAKKKLEDETSKINFELPDASTLMESFRKACDLGNASDLINELKKDLPAALQENPNIFYQNCHKSQIKLSCSKPLIGFCGLLLYL